MEVQKKTAQNNSNICKNVIPLIMTKHVMNLHTFDE